MISGVFQDGFPWVELELLGRNGTVLRDFVLDTGFDGEISLPFETLRELGAKHVGHRLILLADRTARNVAYYDVHVNWQGEIREVEAHASDGRALLGNGLTGDNLIQAEISEGGLVQIDPL